MFSKRVENTVGKGEIAQYEQLGVLRLTLSQTTNCRLFQTERVCRQQFYLFICSFFKWQNVLQKGSKHCGKRRNCSY